MYGLFKECAKCVSPKRHPGCHSNCPDYLEAKKKNDKIRENMRKQSEYSYQLYISYRRNSY